MIRLLQLFSWRHHRRHWLRAMLGAVSVALGVALFVSIQTAQGSMQASFEKTVRTLAGRAELRITRGAKGIDAAALAKIEAAGAVAAPMIQTSTVFPDLNEASILVLGVDFQREPKLRDLSMKDVQVNPIQLALDPTSILVTKALAARQGLKIGSALKVNTPGGVKTVRVAGLVDDAGPAAAFGGNVVVMGIGGAQTLFAMKGRYDWIDAIGDAARLREALGPEYRVGPVRAKNSMLDLAVDRIRALTSVSVIALMVGLFIIYLSVSIGVVERTKEIGTMRALGASRGQIMALFLIESAVMGSGGAALGVAGGFALAKALIAITAAGVNAYMFVVDVAEIQLSWPLAVTAFAVGVATSLCAALVPSWHATRISPLEALRPRTLGMRAVGGYRTAFVVGLVLFAVAGGAFFGGYQRLPMWVGIVGTAASFLGVALMSPAVVLWLSALFRAFLSRVLRIEGYLAADNTMKYPQRTALTVIALGGALAMLVASSGMVGSVRHATDAWMDRVFPFDVSIAANDMSQTVYGNGVLPEELLETVRGLEGVREAYGVRIHVTEFRDTEVLVLAPDLRRWFRMMREREMSMEGLPADEASLTALEKGEAAVVSTNFEALHGRSVELDTPAGRRTFRVVGAVDDFSWPKGVVILDLGVFRELWGERALTYIDVRVADGAAVADVRTRVAKAIGPDTRAFVHQTAEIKEFAHKVLAEAFKLTQAQVLIAMIIGFIGIFNTLLISVLRRTREIGLLRAIGMTPSQAARTVAIEAVWTAAWGAVLGIVGGLFTMAFPISMHFLRITGYVLAFTIPWTTMAMAGVAAVVIGLVAGWLPARRAAGLSVIEAIGYE